MGVFTPSYPLSLPTVPGVKKVKWTMDNAVAISESPFSFEQQAYQWQGQRWKGVVTMPTMNRQQAEVWLAVMAQLNGRAGSFLLGDPDAKKPRGDGRGTPIVSGAGQTGNTLATTGWAIGINGILKAGDYFQIGSGSTARMHKLLFDTNSDGAGNATLTFWPTLRYSPALGTPITVNSAMSQFRLDAAFGWDANEVSAYEIMFSVTEFL
jgi:hypothetical protein